MTNKALITFKQIKRSYMPHYYDYAITLDMIKQKLMDKTGSSFHIYQMEDGFSEINSAIEQLILKKSPDIKHICSVYDQLHNRTVLTTENEEYAIISSVDNNLYYFPAYEIAYANVATFQAHADYPQEFLFATKDANVKTFIKEMIAKERKYMLDGITVLTDTENGLERSKEKISTQIAREEVLLDTNIKQAIFRSIDEFFLSEGDFFRRYNIPYRRGILLYGSPGNGKTTLVKSIAESVEAPVIYWQITEFTSSYSVEEVFQSARKYAPVILIIEDIDSMPDETRSVFLNTLDGATTKEGIFLIGTTNYPERIDPALINRAGRFDRAYEIKQPNEQLRKLYLEKKNINQFIKECQLNDLAKKTDNLSIAQLNELYLSMALQWHYEKHVDINQVIDDLKENQRKTLKRDWGTNRRLGF